VADHFALPSMIYLLHYLPNRRNHVNTRVTLETLVSAFNNGSTAEEIVYQFPVLNLADVYAVITYYLRNRDIVEKYINNRTRLAEQFEQRNQKNKNMNDIRKRLLARQKQ